MNAAQVEINDAKFDFSWRIGLVAMKPEHRKEIQSAYDKTLLAVHVEACGKAVNFGVKHETLSSPGHTSCGDGWYCDKAKQLRDSA